MEATLRLLHSLCFSLLFVDSGLVSRNKVCSLCRVGVVTLAFVGILMWYLLHITHWSLVLAYFFGAWAKQYVSPLKTHFSRGLDLLMELGLAGLVPKNPFI